MTVNPQPIKTFPPELQDLGEVLIHHQCWFFGRDIHHPKGNLLIQYGFERIGAPGIKSGSNCYRLHRTETSEINLWGWGIFYGEIQNGGILIKRYDFRPRYFSDAKLAGSVFRKEDLPFNRLPQNQSQFDSARKLTAEFIGFVLDYEDWIEKYCGTKWRGKCLKDWENSTLKKSQIKTGWSYLQNELKKL